VIHVSFLLHVSRELHPSSFELALRRYQTPCNETKREGVRELIQLLLEALLANHPTRQRGDSFFDVLLVDVFESRSLSFRGITQHSVVSARWYSLPLFLGSIAKCSTDCLLEAPFLLLNFAQVV